MDLQEIIKGVSQVPDGLAIVDMHAPDQPLVYVNAAFEAMTQYTSAEVLGKNCRFLQGTDTSQPGLLAIRNAIAHQEPCLVVLRNYKKDGELFYNELSLAPVPSSDGRYMIAVQRDVTSKHYKLPFSELHLNLRRTYERTPAMLQVLDLAGRVLITSDRWLDVMGYERGEVEGQRLRRFVTPESVDILRDVVSPLMVEQGYCKEIECQCVTRGGDVIDVLISAQVEYGLMGQPMRSVMFMDDITQRRKAQLASAQKTQLLHSTLQSIDDAILTTDAQGRVTWLNPEAERLTDWSVQDAMGRDVDEVFCVVHEARDDALVSLVHQSLKHGRAMEQREPAMLVSQNGHLYSIDERVSMLHKADGGVDGCVMVFRDVTLERKAAKEIEYQASHDALTGLLNRRASLEAITQLLTLAAQQGKETGALLFIDLDRFKSINDTCGHSAGDDFLRGLTTTLRRRLDPNVLLGRFGGDEFVAIIPNTNLDDARALARYARHEIESFRMLYNKQTFRVGASMGLCPIDDSWKDARELMRMVDTLCYSAKREGGGRVNVLGPDDDRSTQEFEHVNWIARLERALDEDRFVLYSQPIVYAQQEDKVSHREILLRLRGANGEMISPGEFLPAAERFKLISRLDLWVITKTLDWIQRHSARHTIGQVNVNVSAQSVSDSDFHESVFELLSSYDFDGAKLCFEITETAAITNLSAAAMFVGQLREHGILVALDDFGAGSSSFTYLENLQVDYLKIDGKYIKGINDSAFNEATVQCFCDIAKTLGIRTVAECVEFDAVQHKVQQIGIDFMQGYLFARPAPLEDAVFEVRDMG